MVSQSKILTVSYGTFSCTLEGFDDPFNTMKAIAEYFRDLAADDRYFGAEPPTPDAAMLHKIAEREIQRRVEAKVQDNGVILTAGSAARPAPGYLPQSTPSDAPEVEAVAETPASQAQAPAAPRQAPRPHTDTAAIEDSVAAKLARIRAAVDRSRPAAALAQIEDAEEVVAEAPASPVPQPAPVADAEPVAAVPEPDDLPTAEFAPQEESSALAGFAAEMPELDDAAATTPADPAVPQDIGHVGAEEAAVATDMAPPAELPGDEAIEAVAVADLPKGSAQAVQAETTQPQFPEPEAPEPEAPEAEALAPEAAEVQAEEPVAQDHAALDSEALEREAAEAEELTAPEPEAQEPAVQHYEALEPQAAEAEAEELTAPEPEAQEPEAAVAEAPQADAQAEPAQDVAGDGAAADVQSPQPVSGPEAATAQPEAASAVAAKGIDEDYDIASLLDTIRGGSAEEPSEPASETLLAGLSVADGSGSVEDADLDALLSSLAVDTAPAPATAGPDAASAAAEPETGIAQVAADAETPVDNEDPRPVRARVIKVRRIARPVDAEATPETLDAEPAPETVPAATLSPEAEAELARELAEVEREMASDGDAAAKAEADPSAEPRPAADRLRRSATMRDLGEGEGEEAVSRLLRQTNSEMEVPETRRRAATIAHLKAAVAATVADRLPGKSRDAEDAERIEPYRDDLAQAVRPRRPEPAAPGEGQRRPAVLAGRIAPLVLVSEQRIDRPASDPSPVRPRRVTAATISNAALDDEDMDSEDANIFRPDTRFDAFVTRLGATELPDLMEAAAAYVTVVDGRESFTRPALMRLVSGFKGEEISREAALRSFGALLRDGRIVKARRGQFTTADGARLVIEARKLAG